MTLLILLSLLLLPLGVTTIIEHVRPALDPLARYRSGITMLFIFTGIGHFIKTEDMALMLGMNSPAVHYLVWVTGIIEVAGALAIWHPAIRRRVAMGFIFMLVGFIPCNVYAALNRVPFGGHELGPIYLIIRLPLQVLLIWWVAKGGGILGVPSSKQPRTSIQSISS